MDLDIEARPSVEKHVVRFNLCGHGHFDLTACDRYMACELPDL